MRLIDIDNIAWTPIDITDLPDDKCLQVYLKEDIDNAPTVEITEEQAIDKLHETGWLQEHDKQMTERPQCDLDREIELYKSKVAFYESQNTRGEYNVTVRELKYVIEILEALRSERPQGEWVMIKNSDGHLKCYECSECKKSQGYISNFCEDCGADMRGNKNEQCK